MHDIRGCNFICADYPLPTMAWNLILPGGGHPYFNALTVAHWQPNWDEHSAESTSDADSEEPPQLVADPPAGVLFADWCPPCDAPTARTLRAAPSGASSVASTDSDITICHHFFARWRWGIDSWRRRELVRLDEVD